MDSPTSSPIPTAAPLEGCPQSMDSPTTPTAAPLEGCPPTPIIAPLEGCPPTPTIAPLEASPPLFPIAPQEDCPRHPTAPQPTTCYVCHFLTNPSTTPPFSLLPPSPSHGPEDWDLAALSAPTAYELGVPAQPIFGLGIQHFPGYPAAISQAPSPQEDIWSLIDAADFSAPALPPFAPQLPFAPTFAPFPNPFSTPFPPAPPTHICDDLCPAFGTFHDRCPSPADEASFLALNDADEASDFALDDADKASDFALDDGPLPSVEAGITDDLRARLHVQRREAEVRKAKRARQKAERARREEEEARRAEQAERERRARGSPLKRVWTAEEMETSEDEEEEVEEEEEEVVQRVGKRPRSDFALDDGPHLPAEAGITDDLRARLAVQRREAVVRKATRARQKAERARRAVQEEREEEVVQRAGKGRRTPMRRGGRWEVEEEEEEVEEEEEEEEMVAPPKRKRNNEVERASKRRRTPLKHSWTSEVVEEEEVDVAAPRGRRNAAAVAAQRLRQMRYAE